MLRRVAANTFTLKQKPKMGCCLITIWQFIATFLTTSSAACHRTQDSTQHISNTATWSVAVPTIIVRVSTIILLMNIDQSGTEQIVPVATWQKHYRQDILRKLRIYLAHGSARGRLIGSWWHLDNLFNRVNRRNMWYHSKLGGSTAIGDENASFSCASK